MGSRSLINNDYLVKHDVQVTHRCHLSTGTIVSVGVGVGSCGLTCAGPVIRAGLKLPDQTVISARKCVMGWPFIGN